MWKMTVGVKDTVKFETITALTNDTLDIVKSGILMLVNTATGSHMSITWQAAIMSTHTHTHTASFKSTHALISSILVLPSGSVIDSSLPGCDVSKEHPDLTCKCDCLALHWNIRNHSPYRASHSKTSESSATLLGEPDILHGGAFLYYMLHAQLIQLHPAPHSKHFLLQF